MAIHEWPEGERPREELQARGPSALSDAELLAIIIGSGTQGRSAVDVGRAVLKEFGSIREFLSADRKRCLGQLGIGPVRLVMLQAALELARRHFSEAMRVGPVLSACGAVQDFLLRQLRDRRYEVFCCLHLDAQHRFLAFEELFRGTVDRATVHVREVCRQVMAHNSAAVIFAHNHPLCGFPVAPPSWYPLIYCTDRQQQTRPDAGHCRAHGVRRMPPYKNRPSMPGDTVVRHYTSLRP